MEFVVTAIIASIVIAAAICWFYVQKKRLCALLKFFSVLFVLIAIGVAQEIEEDDEQITIIDEKPIVVPGTMEKASQEINNFVDAFAQELAVQAKFRSFLDCDFIIPSVNETLNQTNITMIY